jgi:hypothetical protein
MTFQEDILRHLLGFAGLCWIAATMFSVLYLPIRK